MTKGKNIVFLVILFVILIAPLSFAKPQKIMKNNIEIVSDKQEYKCSAIINNSCLIKGNITITNNYNNYYFETYFSFNNSVGNIIFKKGKKKEHKKFLDFSAKQEKEDIVKSKKLNSIDYKKFPFEIKSEKQLLPKNSELLFPFEFLANKSGKFNVEVFVYDNFGNLLFNIILDPYYNVSYNASSPSWLLIQGNNTIYDNEEYASKENITSGISDNNDSTSYRTFLGTPLYNSSVVALYSFNSFYNNNLLEYKSRNDGIIYGSIDRVRMVDYYAGYFDGTNDFVEVSHSNSDFDFGTNSFSFCAFINTTHNAPSNEYIINKRDTGDGYYLRYNSNEKVRCYWNGDNGYTYLNSINSIDDGNIHLVCCVKNGNVEYIYVDTNQDDYDNSDVGDVSNSNSLYIGSGDLGNNKFQGNILEVAFYNKALSSSEQQEIFNQKSFYNRSNGNAISVFFDNATNTTNNYYLKIQTNSTKTIPVRVYSYQNSTMINTSSYIDGYVNDREPYILINSIIYDTYNYPFRVYDISGINNFYIDDIYLYKSVEDNEDPKINSCWLTDTDVTCSDNVIVYCNITDNQEIYQAQISFGYPNGTILFNNNLIKNGSLYYYEYTSSYIYNTLQDKGYPFTNATEIKLLKVNATDLALNYVENTTMNVSGYYNCTSCVEDWRVVWQNSSCYINDSFYWNKTYIDANNCGTYYHFPDDNNTGGYAYCNYCSEDIKEVESNCYFNSTGDYIKNKTFADYNYWECCYITGLSSDCDILNSPYNETTIEHCYLERDFECDTNINSEYGFGKDKTYWSCYLNNSNMTCISYIKELDGNIIQTNPEYEPKKSSFLGINDKYEDRQYFHSDKGLVNIYFTNKNLVLDGRSYIYGVKCSNGNGTFYKYEISIKPDYKQIVSPITRFFWSINNLFGLAMMFVLVLIIVLAVAFLRKQFFRG